MGKEKYTKRIKNYTASFAYKIGERVNSIQWRKYSNKKGGHGFAAEDANFLNDELRFKKTLKIGLDNKKNGPDRLTDGMLIQTKYSKTAAETVASAFDGKTKLYRYSNQTLEVPYDQYNQAVEIFKNKIQKGLVPNVSNPKEAVNIVRKGGYTYRQASNQAKFGNIDSLKFDIKNNMIISIQACGISFMLDYARLKYEGLDSKEAAKISIGNAFMTGGTVLATGVLAQQITRTSIGRFMAKSGADFFHSIINSAYKTPAGKKIVCNWARQISGQSLSGAAAKNTLSKALGSNVVTGTATTLVLTAPDAYKALISNRISFTQLSKNLFVNGSAVGGGFAGFSIGATIGSAIPVIGTVLGGFIGGLVGGFGAQHASKKIADCIADDDEVRMRGLLHDAIQELGVDYLVGEQEFEDKIAPAINTYLENEVDSKWIENMYQSGRGKANKDSLRIEYAYNKFEPLFEKVVSERPQIEISEKLIKREVFKLKLKLVLKSIAYKIKSIFINISKRKAA